MDEVLKGGTGATFLFLYLFPGFLGSLVYDFLVEGRKRENFERIIAALVLTLVSSVVLHVVFAVPLLPDAVDREAPVATVIAAFFGRNLLYESLLSTAIAVIFAVANNFRLIYSALNLLRVTDKYSSVDVWSDIFDKYRGFWLKVEFSDGRSLIGWPRFYSLLGDPRELFLADATWLESDTDGTIVARDVEGAGVYIYDFSTVRCIEMLR